MWYIRRCNNKKRKNSAMVKRIDNIQKLNHCHHQQAMLACLTCPWSGIRVTYIFAPGTSKYAFDGSGLVERDKNNYSMCTFATGKRYNCDLSASYNIGARFFIRVLLKTMPAKVRLQAEAKVPSARTRTTCTLSTLISLCTVLMGLSANTETDCTGRRAVPTV